MHVTFILLLLGLVCFLLSASGIAVGRLNFIALGLAFWILVPLIEVWPA